MIPKNKTDSVADGFAINLWLDSSKVRNVIPPVIQTSVNFSIFNLHFPSWYYTWNAETWQGYWSKSVLASAGIRFFILTYLNFRPPFWRGSIVTKRKLENRGIVRNIFLAVCIKFWIGNFDATKSIVCFLLYGSNYVKSIQ